MSIKIENVVTPSAEQWEAIIRGMRNPKNSWDRMDSEFDVSVCYTSPEDTVGYIKCQDCPNYEDDHCGAAPDRVADTAVCIGDNDWRLMTSLANGGPVHAKYRRMIPVFLDITAPLYWWKEFDTYKLGTVANSCSTMHKIHAKEFSLTDFSDDKLYTYGSQAILMETIATLNELRDVYLNGGAIDQDRGLYSTDAMDILGIPADELTIIEPKDKDIWYEMIQLLPTSYNQKRTVMLNYEVLVNIYKWRKSHKLDEWRELCSWIETLPYPELITGCNKEKDDD